MSPHSDTISWFRANKNDHWMVPFPTKFMCFNFVCWSQVHKRNKRLKCVKRVCPYIYIYIYIYIYVWKLNQTELDVIYMDTYICIYRYTLVIVHLFFYEDFFNALLTLPEHLSSPPVFSVVCVTWSLVLCVCFVDRCLSFCPFSFGHCVVCSFSIYGFWLPLWYLQTLSKKIYITLSCNDYRFKTNRKGDNLKIINQLFPFSFNFNADICVYLYELLMGHKTICYFIFKKGYKGVQIPKCRIFERYIEFYFSFNFDVVLVLNGLCCSLR